MPSSGGAVFWKIFAPASWPEPPAEMTVSALREIEACPRRWALASAEYPGLWEGRGYPPRLQVSSLAGTVVHRTLERMTKELVRAGCPAFDNPMAGQILRNLGGYSKIVLESIDKAVERFAENPRAARSRDLALRSLRVQVPELRARVQTLVGRITFPTMGATAAPAPGVHARQRGPLSPGAYPEVELRVARIGWKGKVDLLILSPQACEIVDFKTGAEAEEHRFQVRAYALLWSREDDLNPSRRIASKLTLAYMGKNVDVEAPTGAGLESIEGEMVARAHAARSAVATLPPRANPTADNCGRCGVRHLCDEYWTSGVQRDLAFSLGTARPSFADFQVLVVERNGPSSWDAVVEVSRDVAGGNRAVVRTGRDEAHLQVGQRVRILDAHMAEGHDEQAQPVILTIGSQSEVYSA
jgi:hypothetical protein